MTKAQVIWGILTGMLMVLGTILLATNVSETTDVFGALMVVVSVLGYVLLAVMIALNPRV